MNYMTQPIDINKIFDLTGKVAIVTGGGDGIGRGACEILAAAGASVVVSNLTMEKAENVANAITANGGNAVAMQCDVSSDSDLVRLVEETRQKFGTINILVNNVGLGGGGKENPFKIDRAYVERIYNINLFAPWRLPAHSTHNGRIGLRQYHKHHIHQQYQQRPRHEYLRLI